VSGGLGDDGLITPATARAPVRGRFDGGDTTIMTVREPYPNLEPGQVEPPPVVGPSPLAAPHNQTQGPDRPQRRSDRTRTVGIVCTVVNVLCGLFAVVLVAHVVMVLGEANPANGVASFVRGFSSAVSLGFDDLFTPADAKFQVLLNYGFAAVVWLAFRWVVTTLVRRFALPGPRELMH
jgi:hypothetical protein